jgi:peptidyl-prolyl cis-trans isomerase C
MQLQLLKRSRKKSVKEWWPTHSENKKSKHKTTMMHRFLLILLATFSLSVAFTSQPTFTNKAVMSTQLEMGFMDEVKSFMKKINVKAEASHILIKGGAEAVNKCEELKVEIGDNPAKFSAYAQQFSDCPSGSKGGSLGRFGPGAMVKEFDQIVFNEAVGVVHGPIKTQFGQHLILINERTE